jgi:hypothetical protein
VENDEAPELLLDVVADALETTEPALRTAVTLIIFFGLTCIPDNTPNPTMLSYVGRLASSDKKERMFPSELLLLFIIFEAVLLRCCAVLCCAVL